MMMNFTYCATYPYYTSSDEAALYFNSLCPSYDYQCVEAPYPLYQPVPFQYAVYAPIPITPFKIDTEAQRSTTDSEEPEEQPQLEMNVSVKQEATEEKEQEVFQEDRSQQIKLPLIHTQKQRKKGRTGTGLKKNTEANLINNIISYACTEMRSHKAVTKLLVTPQRKKIFYTFMNNLKKLNHKYLNRKNVTALLDLTPNQPHERVLARSVKRLELLPVAELRIILRRLIHDYLRDDISLIPILTSKKICRAALKEHCEKRRELLHYFFKGREAA